MAHPYLSLSTLPQKARLTVVLRNLGQFLVKGKMCFLPETSSWSGFGSCGSRDFRDFLIFLGWKIHQRQRKLTHPTTHHLFWVKLSENTSKKLKFWKWTHLIGKPIKFGDSLPLNLETHPQWICLKMIGSSPKSDHFKLMQKIKVQPNTPLKIKMSP